mmetsp:Transcript_7262/g.18116  ORF Transcript_7262/g.18116 Transcript_7262/m.18116 type:complete len:303 (+) Transcript_7262:56-964(+)|eukprot:CAMPEP_0115168860 /NCGR_PEP_ID=MMETSP0270-20121206/972_1 /TAXON_ID=71861 /ORGANISM="Scrippsiella trochoidea, Strain CCMP3099" /LENGTH=302 /DNA_ID=CAMNT_0002581543 /DNA_START=59 /DNA_END=967 /DNA_ORIENTATION=+
MRARPSKITSHRDRGRCVIAVVVALTLWGVGSSAAFARFAQFLDRVRSWAPQSLRGRGLPVGTQQKMQEPADVMSSEVVSQAEVDVNEAQSVEIGENSRLLQSLIDRFGADAQLGTEAFEAHLRKKNPTKDAVLSDLLHDTWRVLDTSTFGQQIRDAQIAWYSGGHFLHDGSILNGGLLKGALQVGEENMADAHFTMPSVTLSEDKMVASAMVSLPSAQQVNVSYAADLKPMPPNFLSLSVQAIDMPGAMGHRTPLLQSNELMQVVYLDDQVLVWKDSFGNAEFLVRESAMAALLRRELEVA